MNVEFAEQTRQIILLTRQGGYDKASSLMTNWLDGFQSQITQMLSRGVSPAGIQELMRGILRAQEHRDFVSIADILEHQLPTLFNGTDGIL